MIVDENTELCDAQSMVQGTAAINSEDTLDLQVADPQYGAGTPLWLIVQTHTAFTCTTGATTFVVDFKHSDSGSAAWVDIATKTHNTASVPLATQGGYIMVQPLPAAVRRYLKLEFTAGASLDLGKVNAGIYLAAPNTLIHGLKSI